jgi:hypothetical protein
LAEKIRKRERKKIKALAEKKIKEKKLAWSLVLCVSSSCKINSKSLTALTPLYCYTIVGLCRVYLTRLNVIIHHFSMKTFVAEHLHQVLYLTVALTKKDIVQDCTTCYDIW